MKSFFQYLTVILALFMAQFAYGGAVTITVCANGCDYTTIANAQAAGDGDDTIKLMQNMAESAVFDDNNIVCLDLNAYRITTSNTASVTINTGLTQAVTIKNGSLSSTAYRLLAWIGLGAGSKVYFQSVSMGPGNGSYSTFAIPGLKEVNQLNFDNCIINFKSNAGAVHGLSFGAAITQTGAANFTNTCIYGSPVNYTVLFNAASPACVAAKFVNCTFVGGITCIQASNTLAVTNCTFFGTTNELSLAGAATLTTFDHCAFSQANGSEGVTTNCITGITAANEVVASGNDMYPWPSAASTIRNGGIPISGVNAPTYYTMAEIAALANTTLMLDDTGLTGMVDGDPVTNWNSRTVGGNAVTYIFTQGTAGNRPLYVANAVNGKAGIKNNAAVISSLYTAAVSLADIFATNQGTIYIVMNQTSGNTSGVLDVLNTDGTNAIRLTGGCGASSFAFQYGSASGTAPNFPSNWLNNYHILVCTRDTSNYLSIYSDSVSLSNSLSSDSDGFDTTGTASITIMNRGGCGNMRGDLQCIISRNTIDVAGSAIRNAILNGLAIYYGLNVSTGRVASIDGVTGYGWDGTWPIGCQPYNPVMLPGSRNMYGSGR